MLFALALAHANPVTLAYEVDSESTQPAVELPDDAGAVSIINGQPVDGTVWPQAGGILQQLELNVYGGLDIAMLSCTGTLIAPDVVMAAAHCVDPEILSLSLGMSPDAIENVTYGFDTTPDLSDWADLFQAKQNLPGTAIRADHAVFHPDWDFMALNFGLVAGQNLGEYNDIALIFLNRASEQPFAYLPTSDENQQVAVGKELEIVGWGQRDTSRYSTQVGEKYWGVSVVNEVNRFEFQVGSSADDVRKCHGDSGGPSFMQVNSDSSEAWRVVGVTSHAYDLTDCEEKGGVDTRVGYHLEWIDSAMREACADGTRVWCEWEGIIPPPDADGYHVWEEKPEPTTPTPGTSTSTDGDTTGDGDGDTSSESAKSGGCSSVPGVAGGLFAVIGLLATRRRDLRR